MAGRSTTPGPEDPSLVDTPVRAGAMDQLLNDLSELAHAESSAHGFYAAALERVVDALGFAAGAVWHVPATGTPVPLHEIRFERVRSDDAAQARDHQLLLRSICQQTAGQLFWPRAQDPRSPFDLPVLIKPICHRRETRKVIELVLTAPPGDDECRRQLRVLDAVGELCLDFERNNRLRELEAGEEERQRFAQLVARLHGTLNLREAAARIANDGRHFVGCDRVTVATCRGSRVRIQAISNQESFDTRSPTVRLLTLLANRALAVGEPVWSDQLPPDAAPQISEPLEAYQDESHVRTIGIVPLLTPRDEPGNAPVGVLVFEQFNQPMDAQQHRQAHALAHQSGVALCNAMQHEAIPLLPAMRAIGKLKDLLGTSALPKTVVIGLAVTLAVLALVFVKVDFTIEARGAIQPLHVREIFAPSDGVVERVDVTHGQKVRAETPLLQLRDPQLSFDLQRVLGEMQTVEQRLAAVETQRIGSSTTGLSRSQLNRMTAEKEELQQMLESLQLQHEILRQRRSELNVLSPIAGEIVTWDARTRLEARPVKRGQVLMSVADTSGPWTLELEVAEEEVLHLRKVHATGEVVQIDYVLATDPSAAFRGQLSEIAPAAQVQENGKRTVSLRANVQIDTSKATPSATAIAKIHCGRRALGYVWLRDLFEAVASWGAL